MLWLRTASSSSSVKGCAPLSSAAVQLVEAGVEEAAHERQAVGVVGVLLPFGLDLNNVKLVTWSERPTTPTGRKVVAAL
jgi:hypothetical protein